MAAAQRPPRRGSPHPEALAPNSSGAARLGQWSQVQPFLELGTVLAPEQAADGIRITAQGRAAVKSKEAGSQHIRTASAECEGIIRPGHVMTAHPGRDDLGVIIAA